MASSRGVKPCKLTSAQDYKFPELWLYRTSHSVARGICLTLDSSLLFFHSLYANQISVQSEWDHQLDWSRSCVLQVINSTAGIIPTGVKFSQSRYGIVGGWVEVKYNIVSWQHQCCLYPFTNRWRWYSYTEGKGKVVGSNENHFQFSWVTIHFGRFWSKSTLKRSGPHGRAFKRILEEHSRC